MATSVGSHLPAAKIAENETAILVQFRKCLQTQKIWSKIAELQLQQLTASAILQTLAQKKPPSEAGGLFNTFVIATITSW